MSWLCSLQLARMAWPQLASHSLSFLATVHGVDLQHHHAGSDSRAAAEILLRIKEATGADSLLSLSEAFGVSIGEVYSNHDWAPSSSPGLGRDNRAIEVTLPAGYDVSGQPFNDKTIVFTGALTMFSRNEAHRVIELFGGNPSNSVSKSTDYLVAGAQDRSRLAAGTAESTKLRKARELREHGAEIQIIADTDFMELVFAPDKATPRERRVKMRHAFDLTQRSRGIEAGLIPARAGGWRSGPLSVAARTRSRLRTRMEPHDRFWK